MFIDRLRQIGCIFSIFLVMGCNTVDGQGRYLVASIGDSGRATKGKVVSAEAVFVQENSGAGGLLGGVAGGELASSNSDSATVILAGIIGGAIIGNMIEEGHSKRNAHQYVIALETGATVVVAQLDKNNRVYLKGDRLYLVYGYPPTLVPAD